MTLGPKSIRSKVRAKVLSSHVARIGYQNTRQRKTHVAKILQWLVTYHFNFLTLVSTRGKLFQHFLARGTHAAKNMHIPLHVLIVAPNNFEDTFDWILYAVSLHSSSYFWEASNIRKFRSTDYRIKNGKYKVHVRMAFGELTSQLNGDNYSILSSASLYLHISPQPDALPNVRHYWKIQYLILTKPACMLYEFEMSGGKC